MKTVICSSNSSFTARHTKAAAIPQLPLVPVFGPRAMPQQRELQAGAFSMDSQLAQGPFSFLTDRLSNAGAHRSPPDVPKARTQRTPPPGPTSLQPDEELDAQAATGQPRFRSALEQVSYLTNESAMRHK